MAVIIWSKLRAFRSVYDETPKRPNITMVNIVARTTSKPGKALNPNASNEMGSEMMVPTMDWNEKRESAPLVRPRTR